MLKTNFKIKIKMLSDWQIGTGAGVPGSVDEMISKDADGFPQIPAKTLVGIWRDAAERLCDGLGGDWKKWVEVIFGSQPNEKGADPTKKPVPAILSLQPALISALLRAKIGADKRLKQSLTFVKVGVKIDGSSGTSETKALRFEEMGRIGTILEADAELDWHHFTDEQKEMSSALLILSAKLVERIGGKRRRGAGKCEFKIFDSTVSEQSLGDARDAIFSREDKVISLPVRNDSGVKARDNNGTPSSDWQTCEYTLALETPVSIVTAVLGNVSETLDFIPGTFLIGHLVKTCGQAVFDALQKGDVQISPATICIDGKRGLPVPKVFAQEKMNKKKVYNRLIEPLDGKEQTKPIREGFISDLHSNAISIARVPQTITMHNAVDDDHQRPTADVVGIYSREAIQAGTILKGEIRFRNFQFDCDNLNGRIRLGTSKKDGGAAQIKIEPAKRREPKTITDKNRIVVYLASDVMLRNDNLRQTNSAEDLARTLGLENAKIMFRQIQVRRVESWQTGWGFPRPTLILMQAGSVVVFESQTPIDEQKLKDLEIEGVGERRGEGYGQIIFNPEVLTRRDFVWETIGAKNFPGRNKEKESESAAEIQNVIDKNFAEGIQKDKSLTDFAKLVEKIAWREELKIAVSKIAAEDAEKDQPRDQIFGFKGLNMAQIGGLRSVIMKLRTKSDAASVTGWLNHLKRTKNRFDKWESWRIEKVENILKDNAVWSVLGDNFKKPKDLNLEQNLRDELWAEAVKLLFYACQQAHKRETEKKGENSGEKD